jgi:hypothetical protein
MIPVLDEKRGEIEAVSDLIKQRLMLKKSCF